ncbi:hypothetical protein C8F01DRAFT_1244643 [Mycena amicta]|nr:hypothetical protein C8F01DRAFT_1244643 [Mycena amicta]
MPSDRPERARRPSGPYDGSKKPRKPRKQWNHAFETKVFSEQELNNMNATDRRPIYVASMQEHIDLLHSQLQRFAGIHWPVPQLDDARFQARAGIREIATLQTAIHASRLKLRELRESNDKKEAMLATHW